MEGEKLCELMKGEGIGMKPGHASKLVALLPQYVG